MVISEEEASSALQSTTPPHHNAASTAASSRHDAHRINFARLLPPFRRRPSSLPSSSISRRYVLPEILPLEPPRAFTQRPSPPPSPTFLQKLDTDAASRDIFPEESFDIDAVPTLDPSVYAPPDDHNTPDLFHDHPLIYSNRFLSSWQELWSLLMTQGPSRLSRVQYRNVSLLVNNLVRMIRNAASPTSVPSLRNIPHWNTSRETKDSILKHLAVSQSLFSVPHWSSIEDKSSPNETKPTVDDLYIIMPSEYAKMDVACPHIFREMNRTSFAQRCPEMIRGYCPHRSCRMYRFHTHHCGARMVL